MSHRFCLACVTTLFLRLAATELYDLTGDDGRDFDFAGYSTNVVDQHATEADGLLQDLRKAVDGWGK